MRHLRRSSSILATVASLLASACGGGAAASGPITTPNGFCTATAPVAIEVIVRDSVSGRALADSASGTLRAGTVTDTLVRRDSLTLFGGRQVGIYDISIQRPGYRGWTRLGVASTQTGVCGGVTPVTVSARLQSSP
ncbi:MAG: hypothetical protein ACHQQ3_03935 [Gemmatimonadales bacterium]